MSDAGPIRQQNRGDVLVQLGNALRDAQEMLAHERRLARDLHASKARYRGAFEQAAIGMAITDPAGRWIEVNPALSDLLGYDEQELLSIPFREITHPDDLAQNLELFERAIAGEIDRYQMEKRFIHKAGHHVWAALDVVAVRDSGGSTSYLIAQMANVSERKRAEELLRENEARYRSLSTAAPVGIFQSDAEGRITYANPRVLQIFELEEREGLGHGWMMRLHPEDAARVVEQWSIALAEGREFEHEHRLLLPNNRIRWVRCRSSPIRGTEGVVPGVVGTIEDITERKGLEAQLRQAQKMEAVGQLAGGVAHDFNNLLTVINVHAELALETLTSDEGLHADLTEISRAAGRAAALTRQLLAFSRKQVMQPQLLDLRDVIAGVAPMLARLIGEDIAVETVVPCDIGTVRADPGQLEQVLVNLAVNARDAMPGGGRLVLKASNLVVGQQQERRRDGIAPGEYVLLLVCDTGCGMTPDELERVFEPFFTTKPVGLGTGLGLPTVYGIVKQSGGHIWLDSEPGRGTTVTLCLPRVMEPAASEPPSDNRPPRPRGVETVLIVEDEEAVRGLARRILERQGYAVLEARGGREALALAATHDGAIDLLLTDIVMPGMNGRLLAEQLLDAHPELRVLYMSGYTDDEIVRRGMFDRGTGFLEKPFSAETLARAIRAALDAERTLA